MQLDFTTFKDKVQGCWAGKNIGGVLGAPFEAKRGVFDVSYYVQDLSQGPPPNDDLDLQIVWLAAVERYGRNVNASILGEYWLSYIIPNWVEYGMGKNNMRAGLMPPLSGFVDNIYKDSCGCFIRSELWACLAPGNPEIAARYAYEDAIVDHADEGMYGEVFFAAMQSAAFVESNKDKLVEIGLSYIPEDCAVARCIKTAQKCYKDGLPLTEMRKKVHSAAPGTFGIQIYKLSEVTDRELELGAPGFDAPGNIGFTIGAWYYGEDDFGKSLCHVVNCGEDTDCTAATLGALMGIISGAKAIPEKWSAPIDDKIATVCIDRTSGGVFVPNTVTELTDRILRVVPSFLGVQFCDLFAEGGYSIRTLSGDALKCPPADEYMQGINGNRAYKPIPIKELLTSRSVVKYENPAFRVAVDYHGGPFFSTGEARKLTVSVSDNGHTRQQQWVNFRLLVPEGVDVLSGREFMQPMNYNQGDKAQAEFEFVDTPLFNGGKMEIIVDISLNGRHSSSPVKIVLMRGK